MIGKNDGNRETNDSEVMSTIQKFIKNLTTTIELRPSDSLIEQRTILEGYLPKQLSEDFINRTVEFLISDEYNFGQIMKHFKDEYPNRYNAKSLAGIVKGMV